MNNRFHLLALACTLAGVLAGCGTIESPSDTRIVFPNATVNGQPAHLALDTGADTGVLIQDAAQRFGVKNAFPPGVDHNFNLPGGITFSIAMFAKVPVALSEPVQVSVGGGTISAQFPVLVVNIDQLSFDGLIGWPEVRDNILVFDSKTRTVRVADHLPAETLGWLKLKIHPADNLVLEIPLADGTTGTISIDTGAAGGLGLPAAQWKAWKEAHPKAVLSTDSYLLPGLVPGNSYLKTETARAEEVNLGQLSLRDVPVFEAPSAVGADSENFVGWIGMEALARMDLVVDGPGGFAYVNPLPVPTAEANSTTATAADANWAFVGKVPLNTQGLVNFAAKTKITQGDFDGGIADFTWVLEHDPTDATTYTNRGSAKLGKGDVDGAMADFNRALELDPKDADAYTIRGAADIGQGHYDAAMADFGHAIALDPNNAEAYNELGWAKFQKNDYDGAIAEFTHALEINPQNAEFYSNRGGMKIKKHDYDGALADCTRALDLDPNYAGAYGNRGLAKLGKDDYAGAIADLTHALKLNPKSFTGFYNRGQAKLAQGDYDGAIADYTSALALDPKSDGAYEDRGDARVRTGDFDAALLDFSHVLEINPQSVSAHVKRSIARVGLGDNASAFDEIEQALALPQDDPSYPQLYREVLQIRLGQNPTDFKNTVAGRKDGWTKTIGQFLLGSVDEAALLKSAQTKDAEPVIGQQCEADYFIGEMRLLKGDQAGAREFFKKSLATGETTFYEYGYASAELYRLAHPAQK